MTKAIILAILATASILLVVSGFGFFAAMITAGSFIDLASNDLI